MPLPQLYFARHELGSRAGLDDDTVRYWIRAGLIRANHGGGGKGRHLSFTRMELGLVVILAKLRTLGFSSNALAALAKRFHDSVEWMARHRLDANQVEQLDELIRARTELANQSDDDDDDGDEPESWAAYLKRKTSDQWCDLPARAVRFAEGVAIGEWQQHQRFFQAMVDVAIKPPPPSDGYLQLTRNEAGQWRVLDANDGSDLVQLNIRLLAEQAWSDER